MAVPTQLSDLSATAASNSPAGGDTVGTTMDDFIRAHASIIARISAGTDALATPAIGTPTSGTLTNCTGLPTAGLVNDAVTYAKIQNVSATDKLLGRSTAGAGDVEEIACTAAGRAILDDADATAQRATLGLVIGTNVQAQDPDIPTVSASQAEMEAGTESALRSMSPLRIAQAITALASGHGQCRLTKSGANLLLSPHNGNKLIINGVAQTIPDAGVTLAPTSLTAGFYYIYAYMSGGTMTLEASTTARAASTTTGNKGTQIKAGDDTRTLVGAAYSSAAAWTDTAASRLVLSWFNRKAISGRSWLTTNRTTTSTSIAEINSEARINFLTWADEAVSANACGSASNSTAFQYTQMAVGWDGVAVIGGIASQANTTATSINSLAASSVAAAAQLTEAALHYVALGGAVSAGTGTYVGGADNASRCEINIMLHG